MGAAEELLSVLELAYGMAYRIPDGTHFSEVSMIYAARVRGCVVERRGSGA